MHYALGKVFSSVSSYNLFSEGLLLIIQIQSPSVSTPATIYFFGMHAHIKALEKQTYILLNILSDIALKNILFKTFLSGMLNHQDSKKNHADSPD